MTTSAWLRDARVVNPDEVADLQRALGGVVLEASYMERVLRAAFAALVGSKYAPVVDGHLTAHNLIETCENVAEVHTDIEVTAKAQLAHALKACRAANTKRNRVIHDAWASRPDGIMVTLQTSRSSQDAAVTARTLPDLGQVADELGRAADELTAAVTAAFGPDGMRVEDQLRLELGRDITADPGN
jgi:hypothetical protein